MEIGQGKARTEEEQIENTADFREIQTASRLLQNVCSSLPTTWTDVAYNSAIAQTPASLGSYSPATPGPSYKAIAHRKDTVTMP